MIEFFKFNQMIFLLLFFGCRISIQRKGSIFVVCFYIHYTGYSFASDLSFSMCYSGFVMEHGRCMVDKATWVDEVRPLISLFRFLVN